MTVTTSCLKRSKVTKMLFKMQVLLRCQKLQHRPVFWILMLAQVIEAGRGASAALDIASRGRSACFFVSARRSASFFLVLAQVSGAEPGVHVELSTLQLREVDRGGHHGLKANDVVVQEAGLDG